MRPPRVVGPVSLAIGLLAAQRGREVTRNCSHRLVSHWHLKSLGNKAKGLGGSAVLKTRKPTPVLPDQGIMNESIENQPDEI